MIIYAAAGFIAGAYAGFSVWPIVIALSIAAAIDAIWVGRLER